MKRGNHSKSRMSKGLVLMLALVLVVGVAVGGTVAWLTAMSSTVVNTFTPSDIFITLEESVDTNKDNKESFQMIPGNPIRKDPKVTVDGDKTNVDCYLFVKLDESDNFGTYFDAYTVAADWTAVAGETNVYWRVVKTTDETKAFDVIAGNKVVVKSSITNELMRNLTDATNYPTLSVTAYAIQTIGFDTPAAAWAEAEKLG